jgi:hypothetical protein
VLFARVDVGDEDFFQHGGKGGKSA